MSTHRYRPLPPEIHTQIFIHLSRKDLYACLLVSRQWHKQAESWLYSNNVTLNPAFQRTHTSLVQSLKTRKHLLQKVEWVSHICGGEVLLPEDLLDILIDYRPPPELDDGDNQDNHLIDNDSGTVVGATQRRLRTMFTISAATPGPNRPTLTHFSFTGVDHFGGLLDTILFGLTTTNLTTLELHLVGHGRDKEYCADIDKIMDTFVYLRHLSLTGNLIRYSPLCLSPPPPTVALPEATVEGIQQEHGETTVTSSTTATSKSYHKQHDLLETFIFDPRLFMRPDALIHAIFTRLGKTLKRIQIRSSVSYWESKSCISPWAVGQILSQCCPALEEIETWGPITFWFFALPILPSSKVSHLNTLVQEPLLLSPPTDGGSAALVTQIVEGYMLRQRFQDQEVTELLLESKNSTSPYFPRLKTLILGQDHSLGAQDLILLGLQCQFLTHVEIYLRPVRHQFVWDNYDKIAAAAAADIDTVITSTSTATASQQQQQQALTPDTGTYYGIIENRRLRKRWEVGTREVLLFLQHCSSLRHFSLTGHRIQSKNLVQGGGGKQSGERTPTEGESSSIEPWACEETLETLTIGFDMSYNPSKDHHALVWAHLGRFKKLRSLTLKLSTLIPSPAYGIAGLLPAEGRVNSTLEEIRSLPSWWKVEDRQAMVLWLARSCPRLRILGLEHTKPREADGWSLRSFLGDVEVERCSIRRVFVESAFS